MTGKSPSSGKGARLLRALSFAVALLFAALIVLYPRAIATDMTTVPHGWLVVLLLGMSSAWVYGLGFEPRHRLLRPLFHSATAWLLMLVGAWQVFLA